jgi:hypothetical protein
MPSAKGSNNNNKLNQPVKVKASSLSENKAISAQDIRNQVKRVVAMPAEAVRAAMAQAVVGAAKLSVVYDALSHILSLIESGHAVDRATLKTTKAAIQTAHASDAISTKRLGKVYQQIVTLNETVVRVVSYHKTKNETLSLSDTRTKLIGKVKSDTSRGTDAAVKSVQKTKNDTVKFAENFSKVVSFKRTTAESISFSDVRTFAFTKAKTDTSNATETFSKQASKNPATQTVSFSDLKKVNFGKVASDIFKANDNRTLLLTKRIIDFVSAVHNANLNWNNTSSRLDISHIGDTFSKSITMNKPELSTTYLLSLNTTKTNPISNEISLVNSYVTTVNITPPLPDGTTVTFNLIHNNSFYSGPLSGTSILTTGTVLTKNNSTIAINSTVTGNSQSVNTTPGCQSNIIYQSDINEVWNSITLTNLDTITISTTSRVDKTTTGLCVVGYSNDTYSISNATINGCDCCSLIINI